MKKRESHNDMLVSVAIANAKPANIGVVTAVKLLLARFLRGCVERKDQGKGYEFNYKQ
jgi:hypothetical protein